MAIRKFVQERNRLVELIVILLIAMVAGANAGGFSEGLRPDAIIMSLAPPVCLINTFAVFAGLIMDPLEGFLLIMIGASLGLLSGLAIFTLPLSGKWRWLKFPLAYVAATLISLLLTWVIADALGICPGCGVDIL